ncbi:MAG: hypothetical protein DRO40_08510 [Thermoprotei archaeon]|nr:MAG: hypothetical protein DRO40_08510 [Thermoprotei archaeon]
MYLLGVDVGTTRVKVLILSQDGRIVSSGYSTYELETPSEGLVEINPEVWWRSFKKTLRHVFEKASIKASEIEAISLSSQLNSITFLDKNGNPVRNSVIWMDSRGAEQTESLKKYIDPVEYHKITGIRPAAFFTFFKLLWFKENDPETLSKADKILQAKDYLCFKLTGELVLDKSMASSAGILDLSRDDFAYEILDRFEIPAEKFPKLVSPDSVVGEVSERASLETGIPKGIPVVAGSGDVMMDALGSGTIEDHVACNKTATGSDVVVCYSKPIFDEKLRIAVYRHVIKGKWLIIAGTGAGVCYRWFRDAFCQLEKTLAEDLRIEAYQLMDAQAEKAPPGSDNLIFLPYINGVRAPIWNDKAKGMFFGIKYHHSKSHFLRSIMEGIAFSARHRIDVIEKDIGIKIKDMRIIGGGSRSRIWRKIMADIYNKPLKTLNVSEPECLAAAILAGIGARVFRDPQSVVNSVIKIEDEIYPEASNTKLYERLYKVYLNLYDRVKDFYEII